MLQDLDELILKCRDERARAYIREAVTCCKAGAYRSAIVSTWIAVSFDIIDKVHELSLAGDKEAVAFVATYETSITNNNIEQQLKIERELLSNAFKKFELISAQELVDLERLQVDRHRCAHPSRMTFSEVFSPPAELARLHIRTAVEHLLQHEPSQGKAALDALMQQIWSKYFPPSSDKALKLLQGSSLKRARPALVRNLLVVLIKTTLSPNTDIYQAMRNKIALRCVKNMHPETWNATIPHEVERQFRTLSDDASMARGIELLAADADFAAALPTDQVVRFEQFVRALPNDHIDLAMVALRIPKLTEMGRRKIARLSASQIESMIPFGAYSDEVRARIVAAYTKADSFDSANTWGKLVRNACSDFTEDETRDVLKAAAENNQIQGSFQIKHVLEALRKAGKLPKDELDALISVADPTPAAVVAAPASVDDSDDEIPF